MTELLKASEIALLVKLVNEEIDREKGKPSRDNLHLYRLLDVRNKLMLLQRPEEQRPSQCHEEERVRGYHKGEPCWIKPEVLCQEGFCTRCAIYMGAKLCLDCWEERGNRVKLEQAPSGSLRNRFLCPECGREYFFE